MGRNIGGGAEQTSAQLKNFLKEDDGQQRGASPIKGSDASAQLLFTLDESESSVHLDDMFTGIQDYGHISPRRTPRIPEFSPRKTPRKYSGLSNYLKGGNGRRDSLNGNTSLQSMSIDTSETSYIIDFEESDEFEKGDSPKQGQGRRGMMVRQETYRHIPTFTWRRESITQEGKRMVNFVPVVDDGSDHNISLRDLRKHRLLGEGMFGQVWLVSGRDRPYAMKVQSKFELAVDDKIEFAVREKEVMSKMKHPFIIRLVKAYQDTHFIYLIMDFIKGGELWSILHPSTETAVQSVALPERRSKFYMLALCDAIVYIHRRGYAYRDLKPENILIDAVGYPVLVDFGLAKRLEKHEKTYTMVGTPAYCSPEIINGVGHSRNTDYWSLGIIVYEMLMGENPFSYENIDQPTLYAAITEEDFPEMKDVSEDAEDFVGKLLIKDPLKRLGSRIPKDVINHGWFDDLSIDAIRRRKIKAPWVPHVSDPMDASHFEDWSDVEDKSTQKFPCLDEKDEERFGSFTVTTDPFH